jgi:2-polyprenyl-6-methoxyphenol hydroxylase-like FAD-dependent oxidoreductase
MAKAVIGKQAVVIGAGMGGLAAAGALVGFFEHVVVLERDELLAGAADRQGTPQGRHNHALLAGGQRALGALYPGFEQDLAQAGAVPLRVTIFAPKCPVSTRSRSATSGGRSIRCRGR